jgi:hypothetical protein
MAIIQDHEQENERPIEDVVTEAYSVSVDPSSSSDNTVEKAEVPTRRGSLKLNQDLQRVSYYNSAA